MPRLHLAGVGLGKLGMAVGVSELCHTFTILLSLWPVAVISVNLIHFTSLSVVSFKSIGIGEETFPAYFALINLKGSAKACHPTVHILIHLK